MVEEAALPALLGLTVVIIGGGSEEKTVNFSALVAFVPPVLVTWKSKRPGVIPAGTSAHKLVSLNTE